MSTLRLPDGTLAPDPLTWMQKRSAWAKDRPGWARLSAFDQKVVLHSVRTPGYAIDEHTMLIDQRVVAKKFHTASKKKGRKYETMLRRVNRSFGRIAREQVLDVEKQPRTAWNRPKPNLYHLPGVVRKCRTEMSLENATKSILYGDQVPSTNGNGNEHVAAEAPEKVAPANGTSRGIEELLGHAQAFLALRSQHPSAKEVPSAMVPTTSGTPSANGGVTARSLRSESNDSDPRALAVCEAKLRELDELHAEHKLSDVGYLAAISACREELGMAYDAGVHN